MTSQAKLSKPVALQAVKGMNDILPQQSHMWEWLEEHVRGVMQLYGYRMIRTPIVEPTALFVRGTGETTDIVEKEMYSFEDRLNGEHLTLRPENTPGVVRAAIEHNLTYDGGKRVYYMGPMFRHERPQRGRYRQFYQLGAEALGLAGPEVDAELIIMAHHILTRLGLQGVRVELNSLGVPSERQAHRAALVDYFTQHIDVLDDDARRRLHSNPLRILDTKNPTMQGLANAAPRLLDFLGDASRQHLHVVQQSLDACGVPWSVNARLVRGLDYYSHTVFEFVTDALGAQGTLCGGGRYDGLFEVLGGKPTPGVGWGMGLERVLDLLQTQQQTPPVPGVDVYLVVADVSIKTYAALVGQRLRQQGLAVQMHATGQTELSSVKAQFKRADASGARYACVVGDSERDGGYVTIKQLRDGQGEQCRIPLDGLAAWTRDLQSEA